MYKKNNNKIDILDNKSLQIENFNILSNNKCGFYTYNKIEFIFHYY